MQHRFIIRSSASASELFPPALEHNRFGLGPIEINSNLHDAKQLPGGDPAGASNSVGEKLGDWKEGRKIGLVLSTKKALKLSEANLKQNEDEAHFEDSPSLYGILNSLHYFFFDFELVTWKAKEAEYRENLKFLKVIDLSNNRLVGEIPVDLTDLHGLISLNLSKNNLIGPIPYSIGEMNSLEILDLSKNQLSGAIPVSMANLSFLAVLDLSNNNLYGCIPLGTQLQGFTEAYQGNPQLRGLPLQTKCQSSKQGNGVWTKGNDDDIEEEHWILLDFGFFLSMTLGFILGFWGVCGTLILERSWRHAFFQFLEDKKDYIYLFIVSHGTKLKRSMGAMLKK
nr:receptor-like protein 12 isoform X1 [Ipomoea batatas]